MRVGNAKIYCLPNSCPQAVKTISEAAKENEIYVVAHLYEKTLCQSKSELVRNNLVFDRRGAVVSV